MTWLVAAADLIAVLFRARHTFLARMALNDNPAHSCCTKSICICALIAYISLKQVRSNDTHCLGMSLLLLSVLEIGCYACRAFPEAFTLRCFAFEPSDQQVDSATSRKDNMVMFPPVTTGGQ